uniref:Leucine-rich repeat-containing N-terminal plant-type domain-containing protein n=1 Tax=Oryza barthii TaxID=65489 RepID=A0A0D3F7Y2_9ORYZ
MGRYQVVTITLPWRGLAGTLFEPIGQLTQLCRLILHDNTISCPIPNSLGFLPDLRGVYLFENRFSSAVPASIADCIMLLSIAFDASNNLLTSTIPPSLANSTKIMHLNLSHKPSPATSHSSSPALPRSSGHIIPDAFAGSRAPSSLLKESITRSYNLVVFELSHNSSMAPYRRPARTASPLQRLPPPLRLPPAAATADLAPVPVYIRRGIEREGNEREGG